MNRETKIRVKGPAEAADGFGGQPPEITPCSVSSRRSAFRSASAFPVQSLPLRAPVLPAQCGAPALARISGGKRTGVYRKTAGAIAHLGGLACGLLLLAALGGAVPLAGQGLPSGETYPGDWTWVSGSNTLGSGQGVPGVYGSLGVAAGTANFPGGRQGAAGWFGRNSNLWLFGGYGYAGNTTPTFGYLNDLWEFNPTNNEWVWMGGANTLVNNYCVASPTFGQMGDFGPGNVPGGRESAASWTDGSGNLWLFGGAGGGAGAANACGTGYTFGDLNDLWEFNPNLPNSATGTNGEWALMGGSSMPNAPGKYPTAYGPAAPEITPGARYGATTWTDSNHNFWLFGGFGYDANGNIGELNDLWQFNPTQNMWAWMGGSSTVPAYSGQPGVYGTLGMPAATNMPGGRYGASSWIDPLGNLWLYGGLGLDGAGNSGSLNDLWEFDRSVGDFGEWVWMGGSSVSGGSTVSLGVYGTMGTPAAENIATGREGASSWTDVNGVFRLFGGEGSGPTPDCDSTTVQSGFLSDLWGFYPNTSQWVWTNGSCVPNSWGIYPLTALTPPSADTAYFPGGRYGATSWTDGDYNLWLFGGSGRDLSGATVGELNDLWVYRPSSLPFGGTPVPTPSFSVPSGTYITAQTVSISDATPGATIYYTTDGTTPTTSSSVYSSASPIMISSTVPLTETLEAIATAGGSSTSAVGTAVYTIAPPAATPTFMPPSGPITSGGTVTISDTTPDAIIFYTTNGMAPSFTGTTPNPGTSIYTGPITVSSPETIEAQATAGGYSPSAVGMAAYTIASSGEAVVTDNETITVTDTVPGPTDSETITVTDTVVVTASLIITTASLPSGIAESPYSETLNATGGSGAGYMWSTTTAGAASLASLGLSLSSGGTISGTPTAGTASFTVEVTDSKRDTFTMPTPYTLTVNKATATVTLSNLTQTYTGSPLTVGVATVPAGLTVACTYNGGSTAPANVGTYSVVCTVNDPNYQGSASNTLTINNPVPVISYTSPVFASAGGAAFTLTVNGSGFAPGTTVNWGTSTPALTPATLSLTQLTVQVPAGDIATSGIDSITVQTPAPGGGTSNSWQFEVEPSGSGSGAPPTFAGSTYTVNPGSSATYSVTLPAGATDVSVQCLNLPSGASCSYANGTLTITTSPSTPAGTYTIVAVFTYTAPGSASSSLIFLPLLLLPLVFARRRWAKGRIFLIACLVTALITLANIGCCGGSGPTHQAFSTGVVTLIVQ